MRHEILTISGKKFDLLNLGKNVFDIGDIAHGLSHTCRFGGQCGVFYSVAQHSVLVSYLIEDPEQRLAALMHDGMEAFIGDIPTPIKALLPDYQLLEFRVTDWLEGKTGLQLETSEIKRADLMALALEKEAFMPNDPEPWPCDEYLEYAQRRLRTNEEMSSRLIASYGMKASNARQLFLGRYAELTQ